MNLPPWTFLIFEPDTKAASVGVRLLAAALPSQGARNKSIEALVEIQWREGSDEAAIRRDALLRLQSLVRAEIERLDE